MAMIRLIHGFLLKERKKLESRRIGGFGTLTMVQFGLLPFAQCMVGDCVIAGDYELCIL